jgi:uncharacterized protein
MTDISRQSGEVRKRKDFSIGPAVITILALLLLGGMPGCQKTPPDAGPGPAAPKKKPAEPQPKLRVMKLWVGTNELTSEIASTPDQWERGLMFRKSLEENEAMLFAFPRPHRAAFWMRNTILPLSCAYLDSDGVIREIHDMQPLNEQPIEAETDQIQYVLETRQGWFERHRVTPGMTLVSERGALKDLWSGGP